MSVLIATLVASIMLGLMLWRAWHATYMFPGALDWALAITAVIAAGYVINYVFYNSYR